MADWSFQDDCYNKIMKADKGIVILPTGSGKSRIEFRVASSKMVSGDNKHQIVVVVAPKIILCQQLIEEFYNFIIERDLDSRKIERFDSSKIEMYIKEYVTFVSCGDLPKIKLRNHEINLNEKAQRTTSVKDIATYLKAANHNKQDSIIFSTYKSFDDAIGGINEFKRGQGEDNIEVHLIADEAHHFTVGKDEVDEENKKKSTPSFVVLKDNLSLFNTRFFFTATPKEYQGADDRGMDNELIYGQVIDERKPKELISRGIICKPHMHKVKLPDYINIDNIGQHSAALVMVAFERHESEIRAKCRNPEYKDKICAKMLVATEGSNELLSIVNYDKFIEWTNKNGIMVAWTMSDDRIGSKIMAGGVTGEFDLYSFLKKIREFGGKDDSRMIIFHFDRLTEGIDIPSMSALLPLRGMPRDKMVQNIGRVMRVHKKDLDNDDRQTWIKPYSFIIVPDLPEIGKQFEDLVEYMQKEYDPNITLDIRENPTGLGQKVPETQNFEPKVINQREIFGDIVHIIEKCNEWEQRIRDSIGRGDVINLSPLRS